MLWTSQVSGKQYLALADFSYNNGYHLSIEIFPFEAFIVGFVDLLLVGLRL